MIAAVGLPLAALSLAAPAPWAWRLSRSQAHPGDRLLARLVWWAALQALIVIVLGLAGVLGRGSLAAVDGALLVGGWLARDRTRLGTIAALGDAPLAARIVVVALAGYAAGTLVAMASGPFDDYDTLMYQLPVLAEWNQHGSIWARPEQWWDKPTFERSVLYYPYAWGAVLDAALAPLGNEALALIPNLVAWAIYGLAIDALARLGGAGAAWRAVAAGAAMAMPLTCLNLPTAHNDLALGAFVLAALAWALRWARDGSGEDAVLALAAAGMALGTKMSALGYLPLVAALAVLARLLRRAPTAAPVRARPLPAILALAVVALAGASWYVHNWISAGNPLGFVRVEAFGRELFPGPIDRAYIDRTNLLHVFRLGSGWHWKCLVWSLAVFAGVPGALIAADLRGAARSAWSERRAAWAMLLPFALGAAWFYVAGPWSAKHAHDDEIGTWMGQQMRYSFPLWGALAALAAIAATRRQAEGEVPAAWIVAGCAIAGLGFPPAWRVAWLSAPIGLAVALAGAWRLGVTAPPSWALRRLAAVCSAPRRAATVTALVAAAFLGGCVTLRGWLHDRRFAGTPSFLAATVGDEPIACWGTHQGLLLYGDDLRRPVRYDDLDRCADWPTLIAWLRTRPERFLAVGPPTFPASSPQVLNWLATHPDDLAPVHGEPEEWGMTVYEVRKP